MSVDAPAITISRLDADDLADVEASYLIEVAANAVDVPDFPEPSRRRHAVSLRVPRSGSRHAYWLARLGGEPVGYLSMMFPILDNLDNAEAELVVHPAHRRRGVGRALYRQAVEGARAEGRRMIMAASVESLPGGPPRNPVGSAFARAMGAQAALTDVRRRLDVADVVPTVHDDLLAGAWSRATGYSLVRWTNTVPEEYVHDVARLDSRLVTDAPMGDLAWEPERIDAERIRIGEGIREQYGTRVYSTGARHDATGRLVALTALSLEHGIHHHAWQQITLVDPPHRGHRLGTLIKIENLRYALAAEPGLEVIDTWNAAVNDHMILINEAMGFRPVDAWINWQSAV